MRHIDHIVVAVRELDRAADVYRRLGFQVGSRNRHPWGTENRLIQFESSFIELITADFDVPGFSSDEPRHFGFGEFVRHYLGQREGVAMLVLSSVDAESDAGQFAAQGIGDFEPFYFERKGKRLDGSETQVAFTLAFARDPAAPDVGFFVCQQHFPENFWCQQFQRHVNSATDIAAVTLTAADPMRHTEFLIKFSGAERSRLPNSGFSIALDGGRIEVVLAEKSQMQHLSSTLLTSVSIRVDDLECLTRLLKLEEIPFTTPNDKVVVNSTLLFGVELQFETKAQR